MFYLLLFISSIIKYFDIQLFGGLLGIFYLRYLPIEHCIISIYSFTMLWKVYLSLLTFFSRRPSQNSWESVSYAGPQTLEAAERASYALQGHHEGGDILVNEENRASGDGIRDVKFRWLGYPGKGVVPYIIHPNLYSEKALILKAMDEYHKKTCIKFVERNSTHSDWIEIRYGVGCNSYVGRQGGRQIVNLGNGCNYIGTVIHELGHAIGLHHEHQRSDRGPYLTVYLQNVTPAFRFAFDKTNVTDEIQPFMTKYDYDSIMHYGNYAFSTQPNVLKTMVATNGKILTEPYNKTTFSTQDVVAIKTLYKC